jgi:cell division protein FtsB
MKNGCLLVIVLLLNTMGAVQANEKDSLFIRLNKVMDNKEYYVINKEQNIRNLKQMFVIGSLSHKQKYEINLKLYAEYLKYQSDSAVHYILQNQSIAQILKEEELQYETAIRLAGLYSTKGMYIESKELLDKIDKQVLPRRLLPIYYETYNEFYSHYGQSNNNDIYYRKSAEYRDSMLLVLDPQSLQYRIEDATRKLFTNENTVENTLLYLLEQTSDKDPERAVIAFLLGTYYKNRNDIERQKKYFTLSAITDIVNCIKDNASLNSLALTYYSLGDTDRAYRFCQAAMDDAVFCNVRYRTSEASMMYPIINESYHAKEKIQKDRLHFFLVSISILLIVLIVGIIYIYLQMNRLSHIRKELYRTNLKLSDLNNDLITANDQLQESNFIKEEYIAHFFDLCSTYINKLENYRKTLHKYASNNQTGELFQMLRSKELIENELEELYHKFDIIFLSLYPTFVEEFKALQSPGKALVLKVGELLNTELRIFALIRLGITDSVKIAGFLRYSISTIYNYRVQARNNATVPRDDFEATVMKIGIYTQNP